MGLTHCYKTTVFFTLIFAVFLLNYFTRIVLAKCCRPLLWQGCNFVWLGV